MRFGIKSGRFFCWQLLPKRPKLRQLWNLLICPDPLRGTLDQEPIVFVEGLGSKGPWKARTGAGFARLLITDNCCGSFPALLEDMPHTIRCAMSYVCVCVCVCLVFFFPCYLGRPGTSSSDHVVVKIGSLHLITFLEGLDWPKAPTPKAIPRCRATGGAREPRRCAPRAVVSKMA